MKRAAQIKLTNERKKRIRILFEENSEDQKLELWPKGLIDYPSCKFKNVNAKENDKFTIDRSYLICFHEDCQHKYLEDRVSNITVIIHKTQF